MRRSRTTKKNHRKNNLKKAIYCGSFNPFHDGHFFVLKSGLADFHYIYLLVCQNEKKPLHNLEKSAEQTEQYLKQKKVDLKRIKILINNGLTVKYINENLDTKTIIRGYRNIKDKIYEKKLLKKYQTMDKQINFVLYKSPKNLKKMSSKKINS